MNDRKELLRFVIAGILIGAVDFGVYYFLKLFIHFSIAKGISFLCAGIIGYVLNKYWTLKQNVPSLGEIGRYIFINILALGINIYINQAMLIVWPAAFLFALIVASMTVGLFTYISFKWWVFRPPLIR